MMANQEEVNKLHQLAETYVLLQITYFFIFPFEVKFHLNKHFCSLLNRQLIDVLNFQYGQTVRLNAMFMFSILF